MMKTTTKNSPSLSKIKMIVFAYILVILFSSSNIIDAKIGVNWGRLSATHLPPSMVVDLLLQNHVEEAKVYSPDEIIIQAFGGSNIGLSIGIYSVNDVASPQYAQEFVAQKVAAYPNTKLRYIIIDSIPAFTKAKFMKQPYEPIARSIRLMQEALNQAGFGHVKAVIANSLSGVLKNSHYPNITNPSDNEFYDDIKETMTTILDIYTQNNSPFLIDFFPISIIAMFGLDQNFAFFDNKSPFKINDKGLIYTNILDFVYDSFVNALEKLGYGHIKVAVSQIGWPTDGFPGASVANAERFYKGLLPRVNSNKGTPKRPGAPMDIYIHSLTDEKLNPENVPFTRHWGIYMSNGQPKYKIDFSGQGRDIFPTVAQGISRMPSRWCVYNGENSDPQKVKRAIAFACAGADCTSLAPGGSCSMLNSRENASYAFNMYFQTNFQDESKCNFDGLAQVVVEDPSRDGCVFPVEVVKGIGQRTDTALRSGHGSKLHVDHVVHKIVALILVSVSMLLL